MSLPPAWTRAPLGKLGTWISGSTPSKSQTAFWDAGEVPWISPKDMKVSRLTSSQDKLTEEALEETSIKLLPAGSVLVVVRSGILAHTLPVAVTEVPATINQDLKALVPEDGIDPDYLAWFLRSAERDILHGCAKAGTTVSSIQSSALFQYQAALAPLPEQRRIVAKIEELFSELDAGVAALERAQARLERYRASVLQAAVNGRLTEQWRAENSPKETGEELLERILVERRRRWEEDYRAKYGAKGTKPPKGWESRYKEPKEPETDGLPKLPQRWCWVTVDQVAGAIQYGHTAKARQDLNGPRFLRITDIQDGHVDWDDVPSCEASELQIEKYRLESGDIVFARTGATTGKSFLVGPHPEAVFASYLIRIQLLSGLLPSYVYAFFRSPRYWRQVERGKRGVGQANVNATTLSHLVLPLPPVQEQEAIMTLLDRVEPTCEMLKESLQHREKQASQVRNAILKSAFQGSLVPQDPNDEPASALLERIKAENGKSQHSLSL